LVTLPENFWTRVPVLGSVVIQLYTGEYTSSVEAFIGHECNK